MSWRITRASPVAGVTPIHAGEVVLRLGQAFDEPVSFGTIAAHLHLHPRELLEDLLTVHSVATTESTRIYARLAVLSAFQKLDDFIAPVERGDVTVLIDRLAEAAAEPFTAVDGRKWRRRFPNWLVPLVGPEPFDHPVLIVARLSDGLQRAIDLRTAKWDEIHGFYEDYHEEMEELRLQCERVRLNAEVAVYNAATTRGLLDQVIPALNKIISLLSVMIEFYAELHGYPKELEPELKRAIERRSDLMLLVQLYTQYVLTRSRSGIRRDSALGNMQTALDSIDGSTAAALVSWGEYAPSTVWYEYHDAMRACAAAVAAAPEEYASPLIRMHFAHVFRALAEKGAPACEPEAVLDPVGASLVEAAKAYDGAALAKLDESTTPVFVMTNISIADLQAALESSIKPVTRLESIAGTVGSLGPIMLIYMKQAGAKQDQVAAAMTRVALALGGLDNDVKAHTEIFELMAKLGASPAALAKEVTAIHKAAIAKAFDVPSNKIERTLYGGVALPTVKLLINVAAVLARFDPKKTELSRLDYAAMAEAGADTLDLATKVLLNRFGDALDELGDRELMLFISGSEAKSWLKFVSTKGVFAVTSAIAVWTAFETRSEKRKKGDLTGRADVQAAFLGVALGALSLVAPTAGFIVSLAVGLANYFASATSGTDARTKVWYEDAWERVSEQIWKTCKLATVPLETLPLSAADDPSAELKERLRALHFIINSGTRDKDHDKPDSKAWMWSLQAANRGRLERMLKRHGFSSKEIEFLRNTDSSGFGASSTSTRA
jgi:hypothetical protein